MTASCSTTMFLTLLLQLMLWSCDFAFQCRDEKNTPVDWFVIYKIPKLHNDPDPLVQQGFAHLYLDLNNVSFHKSNVSLNGTGHAIFYTLQQIYAQKYYQNSDLPGDSMYAFYNDETPGGSTSYSFGHTKGVIAFNKTEASGFWLVHSLPRFPAEQSHGYLYPESGRDYGQTFLCVSYDYKYLDLIGIQFAYNYPAVYDHWFPDSFAADCPNMARYITNPEKSHVKAAPWANNITMTSKGGDSFTSFAKFKDFDADLYSEWLAPVFKSDIFTETWQNGAGKLTSNCSSKYKVQNIVNLKLPETIEYKETHDHSKWAVIQSGHKVVCIGDINRMKSQELRAGGTVCFENDALWKQFNQTVMDVEPCPS